MIFQQLLVKLIANDRYWISRYGHETFVGRKFQEIKLCHNSKEIWEVYISFQN